MASRRSRYRGGGYRSFGRSSSDIGRERARQHIEEAHQLSSELGGTDSDVKQYFFSLPEAELNAILGAYGQRHGASARQYAKETLPQWRSGRVHMSGMVATRLFRLLPPRMPLSEKYRLTENLWRHVGPASRKRLRIGLDANINDAIAVIEGHIREVVLAYKIPSALESRFEWISAGDVQLKQKLLNHLQNMEKSLVIEGAREQLPVMIDHLRGEAGQHTHRIAQILKIGKHELDVVIDRTISGAHLEESTGTSKITDSISSINFALVFWLLLIGFFIYLALS